MNHAMFAVSTFVALLVGFFLHSGMLATAAVNSKLNGIYTLAQYFRANMFVLLYRLMVLVVVVLIYAKFRVPICDAVAHMPGFGWLAQYPIPVDPATAGAVGLLADPLINTLFGFLSKWVPQLKNEVPPAA